MGSPKVKTATESENACYKTCKGKFKGKAPLIYAIMIGFAVTAGVGIGVGTLVNKGTTKPAK